MPASEGQKKRISCQHLTRPWHSLGVDAKQLDALLSESKWLHGLVRRLVSPDQADDVVQEAMLSTLRNPPPESRPLRPWLARVARNVVRMDHRGHQRRVQREHSYASLTTDETGAPSEVLDRFSAQRMLAEHLAELPEPYRSTLLRRYFDDKTSSEIAADEGISSATVRGRIKRGIELLRKRLEDDQGPRWRALLVPMVPATGIPASTSSGGPVGAGATKGFNIMKVAKVLAVLLPIVGLSLATWALWPAAAASAPSEHELPALAQAQPAGQTDTNAAESPPVRANATPARPERVQRLLAALERAYPAEAPVAGLARAKASDSASRELAEVKFAVYVSRQVKASRPLLDECYENARATSPELAGTLVIALSVIADEDIGAVVAECQVVEAKSTIADRGFYECVTETLYALELESPGSDISGRTGLQTAAMSFGVPSPGLMSNRAVEASDLRGENTTAKKSENRKDGAALSAALEAAALAAPSAAKDSAMESDEDTKSEKWVYGLVDPNDPDSGVCDEVTCLIHPDYTCCEELIRQRPEHLKHMKRN